MSFTNVNVDKFEGLNSAVAPELIGDGEARDILNFRMEKVGKLVSRNGYIYGIFSEFIPQVSHVTPDPYEFNLGILGIGELILEERWDAIDTDRIMVYVVRALDTPYWQNYSQRHYANYLFVPLTGQFTDKLFLNDTPFGITDSINSGMFHKRDALPQGSYESVVNLYAPNRIIPDYAHGDPTQNTEDHWIKDYVVLNQYKNRLVISDRVNGDMILEDEYARRDVDTCLKGEHQLHLRPNSLAEFDIDWVDIDPRFDAEQENSIAEGVKNGMALYNYMLPKKQVLPTIDLADNKMGNPDWGPQEDNANEDAGFIAKFKEYLRNINTMFVGFAINNNMPIGYFLQSFFAAAGTGWGSGGNNFINALSPNYSQIFPYRRFTNKLEQAEFDDVLGIPELNEEKFVDNTKDEQGDINDQGTIVKQRGADIYIWEDYQIPYYPTIGKTNLNTVYPYLLRDIDREFQKTQPGIPRAMRLNPKHNVGKYAPLGVWKYKFVWDFGDGVYSAPSTEIVVPDIMWSAVKDVDLTFQGAYERPILQHDAPVPGAYKNFTLNALSAAQSKTPFDTYPTLQRPAIFVPADTDPITLTTFGQAFYSLKSKMYGKMSNKYGIGVNPNLTLQQLLGGADRYLNAGALATQITCFFSEGNLVTDGIAWEYLKANDPGYPYSWSSWNSSPPETALIDEHEYAKGGIVIPIFQSANNKRSFDSVFDEEGRYRLNYLTATDVTTGLPTYKKSFIYPWHWKIYDASPIEVMRLVVPEGDPGELYLVFWSWTDMHNATSANPWINYDGRVHSLFRAVKTSASPDRLLATNGDIPNEVRDRLIKAGTMELTLVENSETVGHFVEWGPQKDHRYAHDHDEWDAQITQTGRLLLLEQLPQAVTVGMQGLLQQVSASDATPQMTTRDYGNPEMRNVDVIIYGEAERFLGTEQLTSYVPSSLLFKAPRLAIKIDSTYVPLKAKKLLIFRTRSTHSNDYMPTDYGFVDAVDIKRDPTTKVPTIKLVDGVTYTGVYYFDDVKDEQLDFADVPDNYEGLRRPLRSRFNMPLNERVYYFNFEEGYRPEHPRKYMETHLTADHDWTTELFGLAPNQAHLVPTASGFVRPSLNDDGTANTTKGFMRNIFVKYRYAFADLQGQLSEPGKDDPPPGTPSSYGTPSIPIAGSPTAPLVVALHLLPDAYDGTIKELKIYRAESTDNETWSGYFYIGKLEPGDEGIFVDDDIELGAEMECFDVDWETYEGGLRWSEPYHPDWIKADSFIEIRGGDGKQGTGIESQYGNLVIFKETSMHRLAVQAVDPPISRVDEISPEIGAIAPESVISINNMLYFLSWKGLYKYDNNVLRAVDMKFFEELQFVLQNNTELNIRDIMSGYNPAYDEMYLNVPKIPTPASALAGRELEWGTHKYYNYDRTLLGHIYVLNLKELYSTKFAYQTTIIEAEKYGKETISPMQHIRMYYTNSLGQMRTADILPSRYGSTLNDMGPTAEKTGVLWAGIYIETPYPTLFNNYAYYPEYSIDWQTLITTVTYNNRRFIDDDVYLAIPTRWGMGMPPDVTHPLYGYFPNCLFAPILSAYKSKFFTGSDETLIKRVRKARLNVFSKGPINLTGMTIPHDTGDDRIENIWLAQPIAVQNKFSYEPTADYYDWLLQQRHRGTDRNILSFIPVELTIPPLGGILGKIRYEDREGKPIRFSIEIDSKKRTQINEIGFNWRPIHSYLT